MSNMSNLKSENISIFPIQVPRSVQPVNNAFYEQNTTNIIRQITRGMFGVDSFVIYFDGQTSIEFNIHGYYVKADISTLLNNAPDNAESIWSYIRVKNQTSTAPEYLEGQDDEGKFTGVNFSYDSLDVDSVEGSTTYPLLLLEKRGGVWTVPFTSTLLSNITRINGQRP